MKLALVGLSGSGKTRVFGALTGRDMTEATYSREVQAAMVKVPDERLDFLHSIFPTAKKVQADFELVDFGPMPGRDSVRVEGMKETELFGHMRGADGFLVVLRAFESASAAPALGKVDPLAEWEELKASFILADAGVVEGRIEQLGKLKKRGMKKGSEEEARLALLERLSPHLEELRPVSEFEPANKEEAKIVKGFHFLSMKPVLLLLNVGETELSCRQEAEEVLGDECTKISAQVEMELCQLSEDDCAVFMEELGIASFMRDRVIKEAYDKLGLISFFTIGDDEVRAWRIKKGMTAVEAAGKIHTDFARGFIRAEVIKYADFKATPSEKELRAQGKARLEGKEYVVEDGDLIEFRFNV